MNRAVKDWLVIIASLADDAAITLIILLVLWLLGVPISLPVIVFLIAFFALSIIIMHRLVIPALHRRRVTGAEGMVGLEGEVIETLSPAGLVKVKDEYWKAESLNGVIPPGEKVEVAGIKGLTLKVRRRRQV